MYFMYSDRKRAVVIAHTILLYRVLYNIPIYAIYLLVSTSERRYTLTFNFRFPSNAYTLLFRSTDIITGNAR